MPGAPVCIWTVRLLIMADNLRQKTYLSSFYVLIRQLVGIGLSFLSLIVFYRYLTPADFGIIAVGQGVWTFLGMIVVLGLDGYLIRLKELPHKDELDQLFTTLGVTVVFVYALVWFFAETVAIFSGSPPVADTLRVVGISYVCKQFGVIGRTVLERQMRFKEISVAELVSQIAYYVVAIPWVVFRRDYWGIIVGTVASNLFLGAYMFRAVPVAFTPHIDLQRIGIHLRSALAYQVTVCTWHLRDMLIPVLLARFGGVEVAGVVSATNQVVTKLTFFRSVIWRVSLSAMSSLQDDVERACRAIRKGMVLHVLLVGGLLSIASALLPLLVPMLGEKWGGVLKVYPVLAVVVLINSAFSLHVAALYGKGLNGSVNQFHIVNVLTVLVVSVLLLPGMKVDGYLIAECVTLASYSILWWRVAGTFGAVYYDVFVRLVLYLIPSLSASAFDSMLGSVLLLCASIVLLVADPRARRAITDSIVEVRGAIRPKR